MHTKIVGLRELREHMTDYARRVRGGQSFVVFKQSRPLFKITPMTDDRWEEVIDFTKIKKGGVAIDELLKRL